MSITMDRSSASLTSKLAFPIAALVTAVALVLTAYFSTAEVAAIRAHVVRKADVYTDLTAKQLESAVAFGDHETAREVLETLAVDQDVVGAALYAHDGTPLYELGRHAPAELIGGTTAVIVDRDASIFAAQPVISAEGPSGTVIIELSSATLRADTQRVRVIAVVVGFLSLVVGVGLAWLIARALTRRIRVLVGAAAAVAGGHLDAPLVDDKSRDELGVLARAFDTMVQKLRALVQDLRAMAAREQAHLQHANTELEQRIAERTEELHSTNAQLKREMAQLAQVEIELRQAQKLEAVGRLAAGVAHELNTPIQFVSDSCSFLHEAMQDVLGMVAHARELAAAAGRGDLPPETAAAALAADADTICLDDLVERVPAASDRVVDGLDRIASIVRSMKEFSHPSQDAALADVQRGLEATIQIARNEYKYVADVVTEFSPLPDVLCQIGELNQVFLNIIVNAAHAIADHSKDGERGTIRVRTWADTAWAYIAISDTGGGIPAAIRDKIFDPFFTTKEVGKGTGQGLAIARGVVVDRHAGRIDVAVDDGRGTTFTIAIPLDRSAAKLAA
jgi:signal transduction histidine kinase